jgi:hypothetical protein
MKATRTRALFFIGATTISYSGFEKYGNQNARTTKEVMPSGASGVPTAKNVRSYKASFDYQVYGDGNELRSAAKAWWLAGLKVFGTHRSCHRTQTKTLFL